jgi:two-component system sensor kinase FixL
MMGEMATGIAHEINQPLSAISILVQAGDHLIRTERYARLSEILEKLVRHAHRASAVIDRMQQMAKRHESVKETIDCDELIGDVTRLAEAEARVRDIEIEIDTQAGLPAVSVDAVQIQQVVLNLLRNGMDAMQTVACQNGNTIGIRMRLHDDGGVEVAVIDKGNGVPEDVEEMLFSPFATTKKSGMGMGLSISRAIVTAHGGSLNFRNNSDGGAMFYFTLPPAEQEDTP